MDSTLIGIIIILLVLIALFFIFREVNNWYWKINERLSAQHRTNFLLEKISMQLGENSSDEVTIEEIATGSRKKWKADVWIEFKLKNPKAKGFRVVKDDNVSDKKSV